MKEFMLLIRNNGDSKASFSSEKHLEFVRACEVYIGKLTQQKKLIAAQPLIRQGVTITNPNGKWEESPFDQAGITQVGYYHILANDINEAIEIAKGNPEFAYNTNVSIEVRPIKMKEEKTNFEYPK